jgi:hypothetical protein
MLRQAGEFQSGGTRPQEGGQDGSQRVPARHIAAPDGCHEQYSALPDFRCQDLQKKKAALIGPREIVQSEKAGPVL